MQERVLWFQVLIAKREKERGPGKCAVVVVGGVLMILLCCFTIVVECESESFQVGTPCVRRLEKMGVEVVKHKVTCDVQSECKRYMRVRKSVFPKASSSSRSRECPCSTLVVLCRSVASEGKGTRENDQKKQTGGLPIRV